MNIPKDLKYTKDHEWAKINGNEVTVGVTDHAQSALGDIVYLELPAIGKTLNKGDTFGVLESIKAVSDLYSPVTGKVIAINTELAKEPSAVNRDPYASAWMIKVSLTDPKSVSELMNAADYEALVASLH